MDEPAQRTRAAKQDPGDKKESEFNHHLAGFFVVLAGLFVFAKIRFSA